MAKKKGGGGKKGGGKKGGKKGASSPKLVPEPPPPPPRPPTPPPRDPELPTHIKEAAEKGDLQTVCSWIDSPETWGHPDAMWLDGNPRGTTMLMAASVGGKLKVVVALIDRGANLDAQDVNGDTALCLAARKRMCGYGNHEGSDKCVRFLLEKGADANIINNQRVSARAFINPAFNAAAYMARRVPRPRTAPVLSLGSLTPHYRRAPSRRVFPDPGDGSYSAPVSPAQAWPPHLPGRFDPAATR